ncbi:MAG: rhodanese-like domain-containing protein [Calditrichaeota bacterium]|nr:MAG: rhodanese-like domain-containing protein [Calditrichota bacterium]
MIKIIAILFILLVFIIGGACTSENGQQTKLAKQENSQIITQVATDPWGFMLMSQEEVVENINSQGTTLILDVRSTAEFTQGHIPGAVNIPITEINQRLSELNSYKDKEIAVVCYSGGRTVASLRLLKEAGYSNLKHIAGDMQAWYAARLPLE